jgi:hypothetical protein
MTAGDEIEVTGPDDSSFVGWHGTVTEVLLADAVYPGSCKPRNRRRRSPAPAKYHPEQAIIRVRLDGDKERHDGDGPKTTVLRNYHPSHLKIVADVN